MTRLSALMAIADALQSQGMTLQKNTKKPHLSLERISRQQLSLLVAFCVNVSCPPDQELVSVVADNLACRDVISLEEKFSLPASTFEILPEYSCTEGWNCTAGSWWSVECVRTKQPLSSFSFTAQRWGTTGAEIKVLLSAEIPELPQFSLLWPGKDQNVAWHASLSARSSGFLSLPSQLIHLFFFFYLSLFRHEIMSVINNESDFYLWFDWFLWESGEFSHVLDKLR